MKKLIAFATTLGACAAMTICGCSSETTDLRDEYAKVFGKVAAVMMNDDESASSQASALAAVSLSQAVPFNYEPTTDTINVKGTGAFVYFTSLLYQNEQFEICDTPVTFTCSYADQEFFELYFTASMDKDSGKVKGELKVDGTTAQSTSTMSEYILIDVDYDFKNDTLLSFALDLCEWSGAFYQSQKYNDGVMYTLNMSVEDDVRASVISAINLSKDAFSQTLSNAKNLNADFTEEYSSSMALVAR